MKGYHQCPLDKESQNLTTFITPFGRFKFLRAPYGISSISEHYNRRLDEAFSGLSGYRRVVDDVVIYDDNPTHHADHVRQFLQRCNDKKITFNSEKWSFSQSSVTFAGFILSRDWYQISPSITRGVHTKCVFRIRIRRMRIRMRILIRLRVHTTKKLPTRRHSAALSIA